MLDSVIQLNEVDSTNNYLRRMIEQSKDALPQGFSVYSKYQTAGRGQIGNAWISERGKNLLASILIYPKHIAIHDQFYISKAVSVAVIDALKSLFIEHSSSFYIKWPNDIYINDKKIAGILIEHTLSVHQIKYSIIGIGLNVNQKNFSKKIPNPTSVFLETAQQFDVEQLCNAIINQLKKWKNTDRETLLGQYNQLLYRKEKFCQYVDKRGDKTIFAKIIGIDKFGRLLLMDTDNNTTTFELNEISYII